MNKNFVWPQRVAISGLPFYLMGWRNTQFDLVDINDIGEPTYRLESYKLFGLITIVGVTIHKREGEWGIYPDDNSAIFKKCNNSLLPTGSYRCERHSLDCAVYSL